MLKKFTSNGVVSQLLKTDPLPLPTLEDIYFKKSAIPVTGLNVNDELIKKYHETRNHPAQNGTSR